MLFIRFIILYYSFNRFKVLNDIGHRGVEFGVKDWDIEIQENAFVVDSNNFSSLHRVLVITS